MMVSLYVANREEMDKSCFKVPYLQLETGTREKKRRNGKEEIRKEKK
jgi:hypothetical protein